MTDEEAQKPGWRESDYTDREVAKGCWPVAHLEGRCPCGAARIDSEGEGECVAYETWVCPRCDRWCSWELGIADVPTCDFCTVAIEVAS